VKLLAQRIGQSIAQSPNSVNGFGAIRTIQLIELLFDERRAEHTRSEEARVAIDKEQKPPRLPDKR